MAVHKTEELIEWIQELNRTTKVVIQKISLSDSDFWYYDKSRGVICNKNNSFFEIAGIKQTEGDSVIARQPIIIQDELGFLGIICKEFDGELHYLMQAKIEPGNINKIQISPTVQATKSNFTQKHGGKRPNYIDYFINSDKYEIIADQLQSEQSSRFYKKRNRNTIIKISEDLEVLNNYKWMTLAQIKALMRIDNLVNMDTRTVLSCLPLFGIKDESSVLGQYYDKFTDEPLRNSIIGADKTLTKNESFIRIYNYINDYKMFNEKRAVFEPLFGLKNWNMRDNEFVCSEPYSFKLIFCDIEIEGREVKRWTQPLFEATGIAVFGLFTCVDNGVRKFLVKAKAEIGCFDGMEIGPCVQREFVNNEKYTCVDELFDLYIKTNRNIKFDTLLSEEGGRFYHEQNRNIIIEVDKAELDSLPKGYCWVDYKTLNMIGQINNCLNIQLRNLMSILEW